MKALPVLLACLFLTGCDVKKFTSVSEPPTPEPTPAPVAAKPAPKPGDWLLDGKSNPLDGRKLAAPKPGASPTPVPKQGDWMLKGYKNPLEQKPR